MASNLYRTRAVLQIPRCVPTLIARAQSAQSTPTAGKGIPPPGNFSSAVPRPPQSNTVGGNKPSQSSGGPTPNPPFMQTPAGKYGTIAAVAIALYAGYKIMSGNKDDSKDTKDPKDQKGGKDKDASKGKNDQQGGKDQKDSKDSGAQQGQGDQKGQKDQKESKGNDQNKKGGEDKQADNAKDKGGKK